MKRRCGDCQLCCRLLPTAEIHKPALARCPHQKHGVGCAIYEKRPMSCALWNCRWLVDDTTGDLPRPDRSHMVLDLIPDFITIKPHDGSPPQHMEVVQVWIDPAYPLAHRAPGFRAWLDQQGKPAIIRFNERDGFILFPPSVAGRWHEEQSAVSEHSHTLEEKAAALGGEIAIDFGGDGFALRTTLRVGDKALPIGTLPIVSDDEARAALARAQQLARERKSS